MPTSEQQKRAKEMLQEIDDDGENLTDWEINFVSNMMDWQGDFTSNQINTINKIYQERVS